MEIVIYVVVAIVCLAVGFVVSRVVSGNGAKSAMAEAERKLADAEKSAENIRREATIEAKDEALRIKQQAEEEARRRDRGGPPAEQGHASLFRAPRATRKLPGQAQLRP